MSLHEIAKCFILPVKGGSWSTLAGDFADQFVDYSALRSTEVFRELNPIVGGIKFGIMREAWMLCGCIRQSKMVIRGNGPTASDVG